MKSIHLPVLVLLLAAAVAAADKSLPSKPGGAFIGLAPETISWSGAPASLPPGAQAVLIEGDPAKPDYFALRLKAPGAYKIMPHHHPGVERVTVIEGTFYIGMGDKWDESALKAYPAGSYLSIPKGHRHFARFKEPGIIQLASVGPWDIIYVDPKDDPRKAQNPKR